MYYQNTKIDPPENGRRFVVGDIHGCYETFHALVNKKIKLTKKDHLYLLGDYINKGPKSKKTLNYILKLIEDGYQVFPLRGNHEDELLDAAKRKKPNLLKWTVRKSPDLLKKNGEVRKKHIDFIASLPYYYELPGFFLVHGGFNFEALNPLKDTNAMLWKRMSEKDVKYIGRKIIVINGHQPLPLDTIRSRVFRRAKIIGLDNGVCYTKKTKNREYVRMGNLCALNIDTFKLTVQPNIEAFANELLKPKRKIA